MPKGNIPTSHQTHPPDLATIEGLKLERLQPADGQPLAALFRLRTGDRKHLSGLYRRADAVLLQVNEPG
ncbi:hypothetical protein [Deinococcus sp. QL22]|uniref:hypothetical protein n=1 Tax=Deinococcus sp. QL22 TaxID=2939437 RepID=UPI002016DAA0|nr:hypothetical protein [Deinococcus sp. QL22]UQN10735.1 hypothetical protein M1R55_31365 [Deinococcus sp. QL22]UQN10780.1 hypothetical protein M1R55_31110 [Deinococcus sp. QL22]